MRAAPSITFKRASDLYLGSSTLARRALGMSEKVEEQRHTDSKGKDLQAMRGVFIFPPIPPEETDPTEAHAVAPPPSGAGECRASDRAKARGGKIPRRLS